MRLNLGSGWSYDPEWTNVDLYAERVDYRADVRQLPFMDGIADEAKLIHTIEHVDRDGGVAMLREIHRVLKSGGTLAVETPDRLKCITLIRGSGPKSGRLNVVEGTRAATGLFYPRSSKQLLNGVKGAMGGVSGTLEEKRRWHEWLLKRANRILAALEENDIARIRPPSMVKPGEPHVYLWHADELREAMESVGFDARVEDPREHGGRTWRDCRVLGVKR